MKSLEQWNDKIRREMSDYINYSSHPYYQHLKDDPKFKAFLDKHKQNSEAAKQFLPRAETFL